MRDRLQEGEGGEEEAEMILELLAKNGGIENAGTEMITYLSPLKEALPSLALE